MSSDTLEAAQVRAFVEIADTLVDDYDVTEVLHRVVTHCVRLLDVAAAGVMFDDQRGGLQLLASSTERAQLLELFAIQTDEGPCLECIESGAAVLVADLQAESARWPRFVPEAIDQGFLSVHALPMRLRGQTIGALNLFGDHRGHLPEADLLVARGLADTATVGIVQQRAVRQGEIVTEQLQAALNDRGAIEQAKGVLSHVAECDMEQAFDLLRDYTHRTGTLLGDTARQLVTGVLDPHAVVAAPA